MSSMEPVLPPGFAFLKHSLQVKVPIQSGGRSTPFPPSAVTMSGSHKINRCDNHRRPGALLIDHGPLAFALAVLFRSSYPPSALSHGESRSSKLGRITVKSGSSKMASADNAVPVGVHLEYSGIGRGKNDIGVQGRWGLINDGGMGFWCHCSFNVRTCKHTSPLLSVSQNDSEIKTNIVSNS